MAEPLFKFGSMGGEEIQPFHYSNRFQVESTTGPDRLRIGIDSGQIPLLLALGTVLPPPFFVLYVLHTSRCGNQLGRYQSPELQFDAVNAFLADFAGFLTNDGRHDLWLHSPNSSATLVWDRHDLIFGYGPLETFRGALPQSLREGIVEKPPNPHVHMYHPEFDSSEQRLLDYFEWSRSPLRKSDEQQRA